MIVESYVATAAPVGSAFVSKKLRASLSPATVRNVMAELEGAGFVVQPHTSAGRVPTDRGYRYYVDAVMETPRLPDDELRRMEDLIQPQELDMDHLLARAIEVLSELTQQAAFVVAPTVRQSTVKQIELVPVSVRKVLCVLVANEEIVASHLVEMEAPMSREEAASLVRFINSELSGLTFQDLVASLERRLLGGSESFFSMVKRSLAILQHALSTEPMGRFVLEGTTYMLAQPEFNRDPRKVHDLMRGLDGEQALLERLRQDLTAEGVRVRIGHEVAVPGLEGCSYIAAPLRLGSDVQAGIGILGPKRMDYPRLHAMVEAMGRCVADLVERWEAGG